MRCVEHVVLINFSEVEMFTFAFCVNPDEQGFTAVGVQQLLSLFPRIKWQLIARKNLLIWQNTTHLKSKSSTYKLFENVPAD